MIESNVWLERAGLFELLAKSFSFPAFDLAAALASGEYSQASREVCHAWGITDVRLDALLERVDDKYAGDEDTALHALRIEYTRLFIGTREPLVSPYGSYWKAIAEGRDPVLFLSRETSEVESAMHAAGVGNRPGLREPLDHIACELEFLQYLCTVEGGAEKPSEGAAVGESVYETFLKGHVQTWTRDFADAIDGEASELFYRCAAEMLRQLKDCTLSKL